MLKVVLRVPVEVAAGLKRAEATRFCFRTLLYKTRRFAHNMLARLSALSALAGLAVALSVPRTFENTNVVRSVELGGSLTLTSTVYQLRALEDGASEYTVTLSKAEGDRTSWFVPKLKDVELDVASGFDAQEYVAARVASGHADRTTQQRLLLHNQAAQASQPRRKHQYCCGHNPESRRDAVAEIWNPARPRTPQVWRRHAHPEPLRDSLPAHKD